MKISIIFTALLTAISIEAAAITVQDECYAPGGLCNTLKRAAEALAEADSEHKDHKCMGIGARCWKLKRDVCGLSCLNAKRSALALAEAFAEAAPFSEHENTKCMAEGSLCFKAKRSVSAAAEDLDEAEAVSASTPEEDINDDDEAICNEAGGPCEVVKRAARAAADALADRFHNDHKCGGMGALCFKAKRAFDSLTSVIDSIL